MQSIDEIAESYDKNVQAICHNPYGFFDVVLRVHQLIPVGDTIRIGADAAATEYPFQERRRSPARTAMTSPLFSCQ